MPLTSNHITLRNNNGGASSEAGSSAAGSEQADSPETLCEESRTKLITELATMLRCDTLPDEMREAGLTLIGWLARRMPGDDTPSHGIRRPQQRK